MRTTSFFKQVDARQRHREDMDTVAVAILGWIAGDEERLGAFAGASGLAPADLRSSASHPDFLNGILDWLMSDEQALLAFARDTHCDPQAVSAVWARAQATS